MIKLSLQRISDHCYAVLNPKNRLCDANSGYIDHAQGGLVVDTQCDLAHAQRLIELLAEVNPHPPRYVVNTHEDIDHVWGNQLFPQAEIIAHRTVPRRMREIADPRTTQRLVRSVDRWPTNWFMKRFHPGLYTAGRQLNEDYDFSQIKLVEPTTLFDERLELDVGDLPTHLIYVGPCHQVGDAIVHLPGEQVVFAGDIVFTDCTPIGWSGTYEHWIAALKLIEQLQPQAIVPGHGPVCTLEGVSEMRAFLDHAWNESKRCYDAGLTAIEASTEIDFGRFGRWHCPARLYMNVERAYREFRGKPYDLPWNLVSAFDSIYQVAKARGLDTSF